MDFKLFNQGAIGPLFLIFIFINTTYSAETLDKISTQKGKSIYMGNCIACHNKDPNKNGSLGPALTGTPLEVFLVKVPEGQTYPAGYTPKRKTKIMKKFPQFKKDVPSIFLWIQSQIKK